MKRVKLILSVLILVFGIITSSVIYADNPASFEITCTPIVTYSVTISTPSNGLDFGFVELNTTYIHQTSATVKNTGNVRADWTLRAIALDTWTLGTQNLNDTGLNKAVLAAVFNSTPPALSSYENSDVLTSVEKDANEINFAGDQNGNDVLKNGERLLWIYLRTPTDTTVDTQQRFRVEIRAHPSSRF